MGSLGLKIPPSASLLPPEVLIAQESWLDVYREGGKEGQNWGRICHQMGNFSCSNTLKQATVNLLLGPVAVRVSSLY